jgi:hypothetical protein
MISYGARKIDKKMLTFFKLPSSNSVGTLLVDLHTSGMVFVILPRFVNLLKLVERWIWN